MTVSTFSPERRFLLNGVSWDLYQHMRREIGDGRTRLTFDQGRLEIMSPTGLHEHVKKVLARLIEAYCDAMGIRVEGLGSTTFDRERLQKGIEPDECYFIQSAARIIGRQDYDWEVDPPPDLAIEIDISPPGLARQPIYAALGVPEIWRYSRGCVTALARHEDASGARYVEAEKSIALSEFPLAEVNRLLEIGLRQGQSAAVRALQEWIRSSQKQ